MSYAGEARLAPYPYLWPSPGLMSMCTLTARTNARNAIGAAVSRMGGASGVGSAAIQIGKQLGAHVDLGAALLPYLAQSAARPQP